MLLAGDIGGTKTLLGLFILFVAMTWVAYPLHALWKGSQSLFAFWFVDAAILQTIMFLVVFCLRPQIWRLSQTQPKLEDLAWLAVGFVFNSLPITTDLGPAYIFADVPKWLYGVVLCLYIPILEEYISKTVFLRSLRLRVPTAVALFCVTLMTAIEHSSFLQAVPLQLLLCIVYVVRKNSLSASIACHIGANIAAFLFFSKFV